mmetsp:Transcript_69150/g.184272  ORF Transcript_69150/g.184272 Transcript_69150/m.184272 type:complete len:153 (-) Transcript_69150:454-912(-)
MNGNSGHTAVLAGDQLIIYGGQGGPEDCTGGVCGDSWSIPISGPDSCPANCSGQGSCEFGFCTCDTGFLGDDCEAQTCPGSKCAYDYSLHFISCSYCSGNGNCLANGTCVCEVGWGGKACDSLHCPGSCSGHGSCKLGGRCECDRFWVLFVN